MAFALATAAGVGSLAMTVGGAYGSRAGARIDEWLSRCGDRRCDPATSAALRSDALTSANVSMIALCVGSVAFLGAAVLSIRAPLGPPPPTGLWPLIGPGGFGARW